jgi:pyridoxal phosphate enzyme (YggS family)
MARIADNLAELRERIERALKRAGRAPGSVLLVAVTKTQPVERIREAYEAGQRCFGENRVQEFEQKRPQLVTPGSQWHLIGHLQSNKARRAAQLFEVIQTVDGERLARRLNEAKQDLWRSGGQRNGGGSQCMPVLIEVRLSPEPAKAGCPEEELPALAEQVAAFPHLQLRGLMTMPPFTADPEGARPYFRRLREWARRLGLPELSMGMTHDFEAAIEEGATIVRVGTAIFGERA